MRSTKKKFVERDDGMVELGYGPVMKKSTYMTMRKYRDEYVRDNYRMFNIKVNRNKYPDIIDYMESQDNLVMYIVDLIRKDMGAKIKKEHAAVENKPAAVKVMPAKATRVSAAAAKKQPKETKKTAKAKEEKKSGKAEKKAAVKSRKASAAKVVKAASKVSASEKKTRNKKKK